MTDTEGHLSLAQAKQTEAMHLATVEEQLSEWTLSIQTEEAKIRSYQDGINASREAIRGARVEQAKLRKRRLVFKRAVFALELIDAEG